MTDHGKEESEGEEASGSEGKARSCQEGRRQEGGQEESEEGKQGEGCNEGEEGKGEEGGDAKECERHDIIPREFFFQKSDSEDHKDDEGNDLLNDLELEARKLAIAKTIRRHREAVFKQRNRPRDKDRFPKRLRVAVFQMPIPSHGHEAVRTNLQKDSSHAFASPWVAP